MRSTKIRSDVDKIDALFTYILKRRANEINSNRPSRFGTIRRASARGVQVSISNTITKDVVRYCGVYEQQSSF